MRVIDYFDNGVKYYPDNVAFVDVDREGLSMTYAEARPHTERIAGAWDDLMVRLGYPAYFAQGGDWGAIVTSNIGVQNRGHCRGLHVNMAIVTPDPDTMDALTADEQRALAAIKHYQDWDSGYSKQQ